MPKRALKAPSFAPTLAGLLLLLTVASCTDDFPPFCPPYHVGAVEGYVREAGVGVAVEVRAVAQEGARRGDTVAVTTADSTGWYRLELPSGLYRLRLGNYYDMFIASDPRDTLRVERAVHRYDFHRGRAEVTIAMPAELEGSSHELRLDGPGYTYAWLNESAEGGALRFVFRLAPPGAYGMTLVDNRSGVRCYLPGTNDYHAADSLAVGADSPARYAADFRALYASISGHVTGSWQAASAYGPTVEVMVDSLSWNGGVSCRSDGSFTLDFLVPRTVRLRTRIENVQQWIGGGSFAAARVFDLQPGDRITGVELVESGIEIRLEGPGDLIQRQATVTVRNEAGEEFTPYATAANPIAVCNLRPGRYYVHLDGRCNDQVWLPQWYGGVDRLEDATPVDLATGELRRIAVSLVAGGRIAGDLLTADGLRPEYFSGSLLDSTGEPTCANGLSFNDGVFDFPGLPDGEYRLAVSLYPIGPWWWPGTADLDAAGRITIVDHAAVTGLRWSLPPAAQEARP